MIENIGSWEGYHDHWIESVSFSVDGQKLATSGWDKKINVFDLNYGHEAVLLGHSDAVLCLAFSKTENQKLASGSKDNTVKIWDTNLISRGRREQDDAQDTSNDNEVLQTLCAHEDRIYSVDWSSFDDNLLVSGSWDFTVKVWNIRDGIVLQNLSSHQHWCHSVHFSPLDSRLVGSASTDRTAKVWNFETGDVVISLQGHKSYVSSIAFSSFFPSILGTGSDDTTAKIWDISQGITLHTLRAHSDWVNAVAFSVHYSNMFATGSKDRSANIWDWRNGTILYSIESGIHSDWINAIAFSTTDPTIFATASGDKSLRIWKFCYSENEQKLDTVNNTEQLTTTRDNYATSVSKSTTEKTLSEKQHASTALSANTSDYDNDNDKSSYNYTRATRENQIQVFEQTSQNNEKFCRAQQKQNMIKLPQIIEEANDKFQQLKFLLGLDDTHSTIPIDDDFFDAFQLIFPIDFESLFVHARIDEHISVQQQSQADAEAICSKIIDLRHKGSIKFVNFCLFYKKFYQSNLSISNYFRSFASILNPPKKEDLKLSREERISPSVEDVGAGGEEEFKETFLT